MMGRARGWSALRSMRAPAASGASHRWASCRSRRHYHVPSTPQRGSSDIEADRRPAREDHATASALGEVERPLLSSLAQYAPALGGELELVARLPEQDIRITQIEDIRGQLSGR